MFKAEKKFYIEEIESLEKEVTVEPEKSAENKHVEDDNNTLHVCPECSQNTLKIENGCNSCINPECGYGKCDI